MNQSPNTTSYSILSCPYCQRLMELHVLKQHIKNCPDSPHPRFKRFQN